MTNYLKPNQEGRDYSVRIPKSTDEGHSRQLKGKTIRISTDTPLPEGIVKRTLDLVSQEYANKELPSSIHVLSYDAKAREITCKLTSPNATSTKITLKVVPTLTTPQKASRAHKIAKTWKMLLPKEGAIATAGTVFGLVIASLATVFIFPLVITYRASRSYDQKLERKKATLKALLGGKIPSGPDGLIETFQVLQKMAKKAKAGGAFANILASATEHGKALQACAGGRKDREEFVRGLLAEVDSSNTTEDNPVLLPCGYYQGEEYQPSVLILYRQNGSYIVKKYMLASNDPNSFDKVDVAQTFLLPAREDLEQSLFHLTDLQHAVTAKSMELTIAQKKQAQTLKAKLSPPIAEHLLDEEKSLKYDLIGQALFDHNGTLLASPTKKAGDLKRELASYQRREKAYQQEKEHLLRELPLLGEKARLLEEELQKNKEEIENISSIPSESQDLLVELQNTQKQLMQKRDQILEEVEKATKRMEFLEGALGSIPAKIEALSKELEPLAPQEPSIRKAPTKDPTKLIETLFKANPEAAAVEIEDKALFATYLLSEVTKALLKYTDALNQKERELYFSTATERVEELEKKLTKTFGKEAATGVVGTMKHALGSHKALSKKRLTIRKETQRKQALEKKPKSPPLALQWTLPPSVEAKPIHEQLLEKEELPGIYSLKDEIDEIRGIATGQPSTEQIGHLLQASQKICAMGEALLDAREYNKARVTAVAFLRTMPSLEAKDVFNHFSDDQLKAYNRFLTQSCEQLFESKLRLRHSCCNSDELVLLFSVRFLQARINQIYVKRLQDRIQTEAMSQFDKGSSDLRAEWIRNVFGPKDPSWVPKEQDWNFVLNDPSKMKSIGWLCNKIGLSLETCRDLSTLHFVPDIIQGRQILQFDEALMPASDEHLSQRILEMLHFAALNRSNLLRFDTLYLTNEPNRKKQAETFIEHLTALREGYASASGGDLPSSLDIRASCIRQIEYGGVLPDTAIDWRRQEFYTQCLLHPEHSIYLAFDGIEEAGTWFVETQAKARTLVEDPTDKEELITAIQSLQRADVTEKLGSIQDRLLIEITDSQIDSKTPCIRIRDKAAQTSGLYYYPWKLPGDLADKTPEPNLNVHARFIATLPEDLAYTTSDGEGMGDVPGYPLAPDDTAPIQTRERHNLSFHTAYLESKKAPLTSLDPLVEAQLLMTSSGRSSAAIASTIEFMFQYPHLLEQDLVQTRLYQNLSHSDHLISRMLGNPGYFVSKIPEFEHMIEISMAEGKIKTAAFLLYVSILIKKHAALILKKHDPLDLAWLQISRDCHPIFAREADAVLEGKKSLTREDGTPTPFGAYINQQKSDLESLDKLPSLTSSYSVIAPSGEKIAHTPFEWLTYMLTKHPDSITKIGPYLLRSLDIEEMEKASGEQLSQILSIWYTLKKTAFSSKVPHLLEALTYHMEEEILPTIEKRMQQDSSIRNAVLNSLMGIEEAGHKWEPVEGAVFLYQCPREQKLPYQVNIRTGNIPSDHRQKVRLKEDDDFDHDLPDEVLSDPYYLTLFGRNMPKCSYRHMGSHEIFSFRIGDRLFSVEVNCVKHSVSRISQTIQGKIYTHVKVVCDQNAHLGSLIEQKGLWVEENSPEKALLILAPLDTWADTDKMESDSRLVHVRMHPDKTIAEMRNAQGKILCQDSLEQYIAFLPMCHEANILLFIHPSSGEVDEIYFLDANMSLKKSKEGWIPSGKGAGWSYQMTDTQWLVDRFGEDYDQFILPLVKNRGLEQQELELRLWPHPIIPRQEKREIEMVQLPPGHVMDHPVTLTVDASGRWYGTHSGFLYLAYYSFAKGDIEQALNYLQELSSTRAIADDSEAQLFDYLSEQLFLQPAYSARAKAFLLKAHLLISKIGREQYEHRSYGETEWTSIYKRTGKVLALFRAYQDEVSHADTQAWLSGANLLLSEEEAAELELIKEESIQQIAGLTDVESPSFISSSQLSSSFRTEEIEAFLPYLILISHPPEENISFSSLQKRGITLSVEAMLGNFWTYWNIIRNEGIPPSQLAVLLGPIPMAEKLDPNLVRAVDMARRLLLALSFTLQQDAELIDEIPSPEPVIFETVSMVAAGVRLWRKGEIKGRFLLEEPLKLQAGALAKRVSMAKVLLHETSLQEIRSHLSSIFNTLIEASNKNAEAITLRKTPLPLATGEITIEEFSSRIEQDSTLSLEEKQLYLQALQKIPGPPERAVSLFSIIQKLHEMQVPITAKRQAALDRKRISQLENNPIRPASLSYSPLSVSRLEDRSDTKSDLLICNQACSESLFTLNKTQIAHLATFLEARNSRLQEFSKAYNAIRKAKDVTSLDQYEMHLGLAGSSSALKQQLLSYAAYVRREEITSGTTASMLPEMSSDLHSFLQDIQILYANRLKKEEEAHVYAQKNALSSEFITLSELDSELRTLREQASAPSLHPTERTHVLEKIAHLEGVLQNPMRLHENMRIREGITLAAGERLDLIRQGGTRVIPIHSIQSFASDLLARIRVLSGERKTLRSQIVERLSPYAGKLGLQTPYAYRSRYSDDTIFEMILDLYQDGALASIGDSSIQKEIEQDITDFLFQSVKMQLFQKAVEDDAGSLVQLTSLEHALIQVMKRLERAQNKKDEKAIAELKIKKLELEIEWRTVSGEIIKKIDRANDLRFFSDESGSIKKQDLARPMLVFSYRKKIGITKEQYHTIERILENPEALEELRMGLGKSSVIFPLVANLLAQRGVLPIVIFTEALIEQSRKDMDKRAYVFQFQRSPDPTARQLEDEYKTLLEVKGQNKYIITTMPRLAALENKFQELNSLLADRKAEYDALLLKIEASPADDPSQASMQAHKKSLLSQLIDIETKKHWIRKIYTLFERESRFLIDEVDEVLHVSVEQNYSTGLSENVDPLTFDVGEKLFSLILESEDSDVIRLKNAILTNTQATLSQQELLLARKGLARALFHDGAFRGKCGFDLSNINEEEFASYLASVPVGDTLAPLPSGMPSLPSGDLSSTNTQPFVYIGAYRHWLSKTLPSLCKKRMGIDFDISQNGYTVTPRKEEREKPNTMFGQEAELVGYHVLTYMCKPPSFDFFTKVYQEIEALGSVGGRWKEWVDTLKEGLIEASPELLYEKFSAKDPESSKLRMEFLRFVMQNSNYIQLYRKQITCRVQDLIGTRKVAGASGTMNRYALPSSFQNVKGASDVDPRSVTGDLLLRLSLIDPKGLQAKVDVFEDPLDHMKALIRDPACKAIINLGTSIPGKTTYDIIQMLREGSHRQFVFIHPVEKVAYFWDIDAESPRRFDKVRDAKLVDPDVCVYYFAPADIRGTDFKIPSGYGALITGPTTTLPLMEQAVWRLRKLGMGHSVRSSIERPLADRIRRSEMTETIVLGHVIRDILSQTLDEDSLFNLKAKAGQPLGIFIKHVKQKLFTPYDEDITELSNPDLQDIVLDRIEMERQLHGCTKDLFFADKKMPYIDDYEPAALQNTTDYIEGIYRRQIRTIETKYKDAFDAVKRSNSSERTVTLDAALMDASRELESELSRFSSNKNYHSSHLQAKVAQNVSLDTSSESEVEQEQETQTEQQQEQSVETKAVMRPSKRKAVTGIRQSIPLQMQWLTGRIDQNLCSNADDIFPDCGLSDSLVFPEDSALLYNLIPLQGKIPCPLIISKQPSEEESDRISFQELEEKIQEREADTPSFSTPDGLQSYQKGIQKLKDQRELLRKKISEGNASKKPRYLAFVTTHTSLNLGLTQMEMYGNLTKLENTKALACYCFGSSNPNPSELFSFGRMGEEEEYYLLIAQYKMLCGSSIDYFTEAERKALQDWYTSIDPNQQDKLVSILNSRMATETVAMLNGWKKKDFIVSSTKPTPRKATPSRPIPETKATGIQKPWHFVLDTGGGGDCAAKALASQFSQKDHSYVHHAELREEASRYLEQHADTLAENPYWQAMIVNSLAEALADSSLIPAYRHLPDTEIAKGDSIASLLKADSLTTANIATLIRYYGSYAALPGVWLDKPFFAAISASRKVPIAIIRATSDFGGYAIEEHWPHEAIDPIQSLFVYYNGASKVSGVRGYHFQTINRERMDLIDGLVNQKKQETVRAFCRSVVEQKTKGFSEVEQQEKLSALSQAIHNLREYDPEALSACITIVRRHVTEASDIEEETLTATGNPELLYILDPKVPALTPEKIQDERAIQKFLKSSKTFSLLADPSSQAAEIHIYFRTLRSDSRRAFDAVLSILQESAPNYAAAFTESNLCGESEGVQMLPFTTFFPTIVALITPDKVHQKIEEFN